MYINTVLVWLSPSNPFEISLPGILVSTLHLHCIFFLNSEKKYQENIYLYAIKYRHGTGVFSRQLILVLNEYVCQILFSDTQP